MTDTTTIHVHLGERSYPIHVGADLLGRLDELVTWPEHARTAAVVTNGMVWELHGDVVQAALERAGLAVECIRVPDGEQAKSTDTLTALWHRFAQIPLLRDDVVVAVGGGVVGDLAGFAAATWNRGVAVVQVPTTLLAQVDSAIGGKTGINLSEGKNLVGAFHQPLAVISDVATLATLPSRERRAGLGEVAKYGFIADPVVLDLLETRPGSATAGDPDVLAEIVRRGSAVKAEVVSEDETEAGRRALLNYGHTVGHAIEALTSYDTYRHGEAVALGMVFAARLGERMGVSEAGLAERTVAVLDGLGLPTRGLRLDPRDVWDVMSRDKKARDGVRFVLSTHPGEAILVDQPRRGLVDDVLRSLA
ncbi:3-dehydroquinate synthase [Euzebya sp.]|uniref:3-dehydroquinate synthase n=1 Tax=Euzebya sp. TaxID=1971409 RepID=UPI003511D895